MNISILLRIFIYAVVLSLTALTTVTRAADSSAWNNPIVPQRADPHVLLHTDGYYYFTASVPEYDRIEIRRATTLEGLRTAEPRVIWRKHERGIMGALIWAPEMHFIDGKWYVYFSAGRAEARWDIRLYVLENSSPNPLEGEWIEKGQLKTNWESFALDPTTFVHRGTRYLAWAQKDPGIRNNSNVYMARMDTAWSIAGPQVLLTQPEFPWEGTRTRVNEAPAVLQRNGRVFMTYSAAATDANYCLGMLTASDNSDLLDPKSWTKSSQLVLKTSEANSQYGPGHNSFTTSADGKTDILVYHARNYRDIRGDPLWNPDRNTRAQKIRWAADGTPIFGEPVPDGPASDATSADSNSAK